MKLYSASWCPHCQPVKAYIEQKRPDVEVVDIDMAPAAEINALGLKQIPCLQKDDGTLMYESKDILKFLGSK